MEIQLTLNLTDQKGSEEDKKCCEPLEVQLTLPVDKIVCCPSQDKNEKDCC